tara:strand:- start:3935 stop:5131 length:1197 start_codon:yes stop_codon:yes gene_type:complete
MKILYITYDGLLEPLGQSQVLAYLEKLSSFQELDFHLISYEKPEDIKDLSLVSSIQERTNKASIKWYKTIYHKKPTALATSFDILLGIFKSLYLVMRHRIDIVHARSYVPAFIALLLKKFTGIKFVFDMRGFWADERVDGGIWLESDNLYRISKWLERQFLLNADHVVSLTEAGVEEMKSFRYLNSNFPRITVIPTCSDLNKFKPYKVTKNKEFTLGYLGTVGTWYLFEETVKAFAELLKIRPESNIFIINKGEHEYISKCLEDKNIPLSRIELISSDYEEIPLLINKMDAAIFFIKPVFSKQSSSPTKLAELLGCGIPCLSNKGVGDMSRIIDAERVGISLGDFSESSIANGITNLISLSKEPDIKDRCINAAYKYFSLEEGVIKYKKIYKSLVKLK